MQGVYLLLDWLLLNRVMAVIGRNVTLFLFQVWNLFMCLVSPLLITDSNSDTKYDSSSNNESQILSRNSNMEMIGIVVALTDYLTTNVRQSIDNRNEDKDHKEKITHFGRMQNEFDDHKEGLKTINRDIKMTGLLMGYSQHEERIKHSLLAFHQYLEDPNENNRNIFMLEAAHLTKSIGVIVDGLLGQNAFNPDITAVMQDFIGCHGRQLHNKIKSIMSIVMTGLWIRGEYHRLSNITELDSSHFKTFITSSRTKITKRLDDMAIECQADEKNVVKEMRNIMKTQTSRDKKTVADSLLQFLEDKYDTKKWIVIVLPNSSEDWMAKHGNWSGITSAKWHYVNEKSTTALAISTVNYGSDLSKLVNTFLEKFQVPIRTLPNFLFQISKYYVNVKEIHEHLNRFLLPLRAKNRAEIETLVIKVDPAKVNIVASNGTEYTRLSDEINCCHLITVVPVRPNAKSSIKSTNNDKLKCDYKLRDSNKAGLLRNEFSQAYLSVFGDINQEGLPIILDVAWKNSSGQRWRFVDNQLMNDHDKCLTAWTRGSSFLYQYDCRPDWIGQKWYRNGLQIVNGYNMCLDYNGGTMAVVQNYCDSTPSFLWDDWETSCEDTIVPLSINGEFRNEFSRRYLSVYSDEEYVFDKPWNSSPGKSWTFVDGALKNSFGKCLAGIGWYVQQVDCDDEKTDNKRWIYNQKRQIVSAEGYCLAVGNKKGYVSYSDCKDSSEYRWLHY